ncbi:MAG: hypothetical protein ACREYC_08845, partial [Gammaproteobacteria bacterium]
HRKLVCRGLSMARQPKEAYGLSDARSATAMRHSRASGNPGGAMRDRYPAVSARQSAQRNALRAVTSDLVVRVWQHRKDLVEVLYSKVSGASFGLFRAA